MFLNTEYRTDGNHKFLILSGDGHEENDSFRVRMLEENRISGLLPCTVQRMDGRFLFYYTVTDQISLEEALREKRMDRSLIQLLFTGAAGAMDSLTEYLLDSNGLLMRPDCIFLDRRQERISFCFFPFQEDMREQLRSLGEYILPKLDPGDREAAGIGYAFYGYCSENRANLISAELFLRFLHRDDRPDKKEEEERELQRQREDRSLLLDAFFAEEESPEPGLFGKFRKQRKEDPAGKREKNSASERKKHRISRKYSAIAIVITTAAAIAAAVLPAYFGYRTAGPVLSSVILVGAAVGFVLYYKNSKTDRTRDAGFPADMFRVEEKPADRSADVKCTADRHQEPARNAEEQETVFLQAESGTASPQKSRAVLSPEAGSGLQPLSLCRDLHLVGKSRQSADLPVPVSVVSRLHARLFWDGTAYRLLDLNSRNGTFVNGIRLEPGGICSLKSGDSICFGNVTYTYQEAKKYE